MENIEELKLNFYVASYEFYKSVTSYKDNEDVPITGLSLEESLAVRIKNLKKAKIIIDNIDSLD